MISTSLAAALLLSVLAFATAPRAFADDDRSKCQHRIEKAEARYTDAVRDHGERSSEAAKRRHELNDERERCYQAYHSWWNGQDHQWHNDRDWDRDDHDHDHDQH
jgi:hypothetical protein